MSVHSEPDLGGKDFQVAIHPRISKGGRPQMGWVVQGKVKQAFAINPPVVDFEQSLVRGQSFAPRWADITCELDVVELTAHCDSPSFHVMVKREGTNSRRFRLEFQPRKDMPSGPFNHLVKLSASTPSKKEVCGVVPVIGRLFEDIRLQPEFLVFGAERVGTKLVETVVLQSRSEQVFSVRGIDKEGADGVAIERIQKQENGSQRLVVSFPVRRLGQQTYEFHVKVHTQQGPLSLPLKISCYGIPERISHVSR